MDYSKVKLFILLNLLEEKETGLVKARSKIAIKCLRLDSNIESKSLIIESTLHDVFVYKAGAFTYFFRT